MVELDSHEVAALRASGQSLEVAFQVGKAGITEGVVKELQAHLSREPLIKVKVMKGAREDADTRQVAEELAKLARVRLIEVRGHTALFYRAPRNKRAPDEF